MGRKKSLGFKLLNPFKTTWHSKSKAVEEIVC